MLNISVVLKKFLPELSFEMDGSVKEASMPDVLEIGFQRCHGLQLMLTYVHW
jgi:hypothetical protein